MASRVAGRAGAEGPGETPLRRLFLTHNPKIRLAQVVGVRPSMSRGGMISCAEERLI